MTELHPFGLADALLLIGTLSLGFAALCALADYAIPRLVLLRRRRQPQPRLAPLMREEYRR